MYFYNEENCLNELIGDAFVELFICIACIISTYYLCRVYKDKLHIIVIVTVLKIIISNTLTQYLSSYVLSGTVTQKYYISCIDCFMGMLVVAAIKMESRARISEILLVTVLQDAIAVSIFVTPYYLLRNILCDGDIYFYNSPYIMKSVLLIVALVIIYTLGLFLVKIISTKICKYFVFKHKITRVIAYIIFIAALLSSFSNYYKDKAYENGNINVFFIITVLLGVAMPYAASVYSRKKEMKEKEEEREQLLKEKEEIMDSNDSGLKEQIDDRKIRHDIDKHMNVIKEMIEEGATEEDVEEYAKGIGETYKG